ncbi:MAG: DUF4154 domain-containing protein [Desulfobacterales bacterium]|nr:DUF4154 domain-containing protein [Desulfobacterales bacterium]
MVLKKTIPLLIGFFICYIIPIYGYAHDKVPEKLQAALFVKILSMSKDINNGKNLTIYVVNSPDQAMEFKKAEGRMIGKSMLVSVQEGDGLPNDLPSVMYIGNTYRVEELIQYCRSKQILSITGNPELVEKGVTLGLCMNEDRPLILLNITSKKKKKITWHPTLLKLSKIYK